MPTLDAPECALDPYAGKVLGILMHELHERPSVIACQTTFLYSLIGHGLCVLQAWDATLPDKEHPTKEQCWQVSDRIVRFYAAQLCPDSMQLIRPGEAVEAEW